jgi:hypothetical protein
MPLDVGAAYCMEELLESSEDLTTHPHPRPCDRMFRNPCGKPLVMVGAQLRIDRPFRQQTRELCGRAIGKVIHCFEQQEVARLDRHRYRALFRAAIAG